MKIKLKIVESDEAVNTYYFDNMIEVLNFINKFFDNKKNVLDFIKEKNFRFYLTKLEEA